MVVIEPEPAGVAVCDYILQAVYILASMQNYAAYAYSSMSGISATTATEFENDLPTPPVGETVQVKLCF